MIQFTHGERGKIEDEVRKPSPSSERIMPTTIRLSLAEYDAMIASRVLDERRHQRIELIEGEMCEMSPPGPMHEDMVDTVMRWCVANTDRKSVRVRVQNSIGLSDVDSAPMPDVAVVVEKDYRSQRPQPDDVLLLIEVADSSLAFDRGEKAELYAAAGIREYWIINLPEWCVEVYRESSKSGYRQKQTFDGHSRVEALLLPSLVLEVGPLFQ